MSNTTFSRPHVRGAIVVLVAAFAATLIPLQISRAGTWKGLEPFISKRADVERVLGPTILDRMSKDGSLQFKVSGGSVTVQFVDAKFVAAKKLSPALEGTVLQIVLQHERATDTPQSLNLTSNKDFSREERDNVMIYRNLKDGIFYTFIDGKLRTTRYAASVEQIAQAQKR